MSEEKSSYRQIMKATSIFGGVQVINIFVQIMRSKIIAVLLGPAGMGVVGLLTTSVGLMGAVTNFGLGTSAVRDISEAHATGNGLRVGKVVSVLRRLVWLTGLLGLVLTFLAAPFLSRYTFGDEDYTVAFRWLSVSLLFNQLASGQIVLLQGTRQLKYMAKANVLGAVLGLLISTPFYYFYRIDGIVPAIIVSSLLALIISWFYSRRLPIEIIPTSKTEVYNEGKSMLKMGFMISLSGLITVTASYVIRAFISRTGSLEDVGLYSAGFAIIGSYVGLIFTAMGTDYYPRLAAVSSCDEKSKAVINHQAEIAILILAPVILIFVVFIKWIVILLYSAKFSSIDEMILYAALGMLFKAASWAIAFLFLAKGESKLFFWNELVTNIYLLGLNLIGYYYLGLTGLGISFLGSYFLYLIQVYIVAKKKYNFSYDHTFLRIFVIQLLLAAATLLTVKLICDPYIYIIGFMLIGLSSIFSFKELDKRLDLKTFVKKFKK